MLTTTLNLLSVSAMNAGHEGRASTGVDRRDNVDLSVLFRLELGLEK